VRDDPAGVASLVGLDHVLVALIVIGGDNRQSGAFVHLAYLFDRKCKHVVTSARLLLGCRTEGTHLPERRRLLKPRAVGCLKAPAPFPGVFLEFQ
jgi:hypothetical protein